MPAFNPLTGINTGPVVNQARINAALATYTALKAEWDKLQAMTDALNATGSPSAYLYVSGCDCSTPVAAVTASNIIAARGAAIGNQLANLGTILTAAGATLP